MTNQEQEPTPKEKGLLKLASKQQATISFLNRDLQVARDYIFELGGVEAIVRWGAEVKELGCAKCYANKGLYTNKKGKTHWGRYNKNGKYLGKWKDGDEAQVVNWWTQIWNDTSVWSYEKGKGFVWIGEPLRWEKKEDEK
jgi:hypothetical protein